MNIEHRIEDMTAIIQQQHDDIAKLTVEIYSLKQKLRDYFDKVEETVDI